MDRASGPLNNSFCRGRAARRRRRARPGPPNESRRLCVAVQSHAREYECAAAGSTLLPLCASLAFSYPFPPVVCLFGQDAGRGGRAGPAPAARMPARQPLPCYQPCGSNCCRCAPRTAKLGPLSPPPGAAREAAHPPLLLPFEEPPFTLPQPPRAFWPLTRPPAFLLIFQLQTFEALEGRRGAAWEIAPSPRFIGTLLCSKKHSRRARPGPLPPFGRRLRRRVLSAGGPGRGAAPLMPVIALPYIPRISFSSPGAKPGGGAAVPPALPPSLPPLSGFVGACSKQ